MAEYPHPSNAMQIKIYSLVGTYSQLLLKVEDVAEILHYGKRLKQPQTIKEMEMAAIGMERPIPFGRLDEDVPVSVHPQLSRGYFGSPGLEGHREDRTCWAPQFIVQSVNEERDKIKGNSLCLIGKDDEAELQLEVKLRLDQYDVLQVSQTLTNLGETEYSVTRLANTVPLQYRAKELLSFYGRWIKEFQPERTVLGRSGGWVQENRRGRTSHEHYPAVVVGSVGFKHQVGEVWGAHLAWSGNHRMRVDVKADGRRTLQAEALYFPGECILAKGETLTTPTLYMSYSDKGLNGMSQQFHQHCRQIILKNRLVKPRPIHLNIWEGIYFKHDPNYIAQMAAKAAEMGVERFIVDDGWFMGRNDDTSSLGDWYVDKNKYPAGIGPLVDHVHALGMEFGLWFEPEMINKNSHLYRKHPDWLLAVDNYVTPTGRNQYVLDLQNPAVSDYLLERLDYFLSTYAIDYIKWDMNREIVQPGHNGIAAGIKQVQALYALLDNIRTKHPNVEIESCASGGGRIDYEILKRVERFWTSDNNDPLERQTIQRGMSYFFPPEVMGCHIGASQSHLTRRCHNIHFRGLTALFGHMGLELDPIKSNEEERHAFSHYVGLHKQWRTLLHSGTTFCLDLDDDDAHMATMVMSVDGRKALVILVQLKMPTHALSGNIRFPGLDVDAKYQIELIEEPPSFHEMVNRQPSWTTKKLTFQGEWLQEIGLATPILYPESALLIVLRRQ